MSFIAHIHDWNKILKWIYKQINNVLLCIINTDVFVLLIITIHEIANTNW